MDNDNDAVTFSGALGIAVLQRLLGVAPDAPDGFGVEPTDSVELHRLRSAIDDLLPFPTEKAEQDGDYYAAVKYAAEELASTRARAKSLQSSLDDANAELAEIVKVAAPYARPGRATASEMVTQLRDLLVKAVR